jgi:hypothetical protein
MSVIVRNARRRQQDTLGPELEVRVERLKDGYRRVETSPSLRGVVRRRSTASAVGGVYVALVVSEQTGEITSNSSGVASYRPVITKLWEHEVRLEATADDVYPFDLPLPEPGSVPFSVPRDKYGRGVRWDLSTRIVRDDRPVDETARCPIDVRPTSRQRPT